MKRKTLIALTKVLKLNEPSEDMINISILKEKHRKAFFVV